MIAKANKIKYVWVDWEVGISSFEALGLTRLTRHHLFFQCVPQYVIDPMTEWVHITYM